ATNTTSPRISRSGRIRPRSLGPRSPKATGPSTPIGNGPSNLTRGMRRARRLVRPEARRGVLVRLGTASVDDGDGVEIEDPSRPLQILSVLDADISSLGDA